MFKKCSKFSKTGLFHKPSCHYWIHKTLVTNIQYDKILTKIHKSNPSATNRSEIHVQYTCLVLEKRVFISSTGHTLWTMNPLLLFVRSTLNHSSIKNPPTSKLKVYSIFVPSIYLSSLKFYSLLFNCQMSIHYEFFSSSKIGFSSITHKFMVILLSIDVLNAGNGKQWYS